MMAKEQEKVFKCFHHLYLKIEPSSLILVIVILSQILTTPTVLADEDLTCQKGVSGFPGATFPRGDILLKEGETLQVYCRLDKQKTPYNATFIKFKFTKANVSEHLMKTTVINETTALLQVERMNVSSPHLSCEIAPPGLPRIQVCQNEIDVGFPPQPVENFKCIAPQWRSLNCTWKKPNNPIPTNYAIQILTKYKSSSRVGVTSCPNTTVTPTSCVWGPRTEPFYRQNLNPLLFRINGTNVLDPFGSTWDFLVDHWAIIVPDSPSDLKIKHAFPNNVTIGWTFKTFKDFQPGLAHQVSVCIQNHTVPCNVTNLSSVKNVDSLQITVPLDYAYVNYTVEIRMRSQKAKDEPEFWSESSFLVVASEARSPEAPPMVDVGSYESVPVSTKKRDIYVYWEEVPHILRNGPDFHYTLIVYEDGIQVDIQPKEITGSFAKFIGLRLETPYRFHIKSGNAVGISTDNSTIYVPRNKKAPELPTAVSKLDYSNGSFLVSWNPANSTAPIISYTVFRCISSKPRPYQCQGLLKWDVVSAGKQSKLYDYLPHDSVYQFAVSANTDSMSSGMAWASCTLIHGKVPEKLNRIEKKFEDEKEVYIQWQLDCSYKPGVIDGFKISYCRVEREKQFRCIDNEKSEAVSGANVTTFHLKKLQPCSTYLIAVSIITEHGESQKSDPVFATTKQSAPTNPPEARATQVTNTTAVITVKPSYPLNGVVRGYEIWYKSETGETGKYYQPTKNAESSGSDGCVDDGSLPKQTDVEVKDLASNTNYTFTVSVCTIKCSGVSETGYFKTKIGYTNMTQFPLLKVDGSDMTIEWNVPPASGIKSFEVRVKQDGKEQDPEFVDFLEGTLSYDKKVKFSCETDTNFTAQVRAITVVDSGELLYGSWSPPANFNCGGGASWIIWVGVVISIILIIALMGIISTKIYQKFKVMKEFNVKLPPGLAVQDLNGFSHSHPKRRKDSDGDTQSFGKENLTYQLQMTTTNHSDDSKEFASLEESCLQENKTTGESFYKAYEEELEEGEDSPSKSEHSSCPTLTLMEMINANTINLSKNLEHESLIGNVKRSSPSPTNPLLENSIPTEEEDSPQLHYSNVNVHDFLNGLGSGSFMPSNNSSRTVSPSPLPSGSNQVSFEDRNGVPSSSFGAPRCSNAPSGLPNGVHALPTVNPGSSYVKWMPQQFMNGGSVEIDHSRKTPYCQVGILLDSN